jgi:amino acid transporter
MKSHNDEGLSREIGMMDVAANVVNLTIGAGIFILPAIVYEKLGSSAFLAYIICSIIIFLLMMCFAELGSRSASSGFVYTHIRDVFGEFVAFITSNLYWFGFGLISDAAIANVLLQMIAPFFPFLDTLQGELVFFLIIFGTLAFVNIRGVKYGTAVVRVLTISKLLPLIVLLVLGWREIEVPHLEWVSNIDAGSLGDGCLILFFAFVGGEATLMAGGEIKSPRRNIPLGLFVGISVAIVFYIMMQILSQGILGSELGVFGQNAFLQVSSIVLGDSGAAFMTMATALAILGAISGDILVMPRLLFAASKSDLFLGSLSAVHSRFKTPHLAIIMYSFLGFVFSISASFRELAILSSTACLVTYLMVLLALIG